MKLVVAIKMRGGPESFYRAGIRFTRTPTEVDVTKEQAKAILNDPMLDAAKPMPVKKAKEAKDADVQAADE